MNDSLLPDSLDNDLLFIDRGLDYLRKVKDFRAGLTGIVRSAAAIMGSDCASFYLLRQSTASLEPYILVNVPDQYLKGCRSVPLGTQCCGRAALHKVPWAVADMWSDPLFIDCSAAARESGMRAGFSVPVMLFEEECLGTLAVQFRHVYEPKHSDIARLRLFARLISVAALAEMKDRDANYRDWVTRQLAAGPVAA